MTNPAGALSLHIENTEVTLAAGGAAARGATRGLPPGLIVSGHYQLGRLLGSGGMGLVYEAQHLVLGTTVALKVLRPELQDDPWLVTRAQSEARCLAVIDSEHVVRISDAGRLPAGLPYLVLERLHGTTLADVISSCGGLPPSIVLDYALQACRGLSAIHARGMVHRDIKPANLFLEARSDLRSRVKIIDFGLAGATERDVPTGEEPVWLGSPAYIAPEQRQNWRAVDARADLWSLGVVMFELLTGTNPFRDSSVPGVRAPASGGARPRLLELRPTFPRELAAIVERCMEPERERRFSSVDELVHALKPFTQTRRRPLPPHSRAHQHKVATVWPAAFDAGGPRSTFERTLTT